MHIDALESRRFFHLLRALPALAAIGCSNPSLLGISAEVDEERATRAWLTSVPPVVVQALRSSTVISGAADENPLLRRPTLGDVDGDGLDDFAFEAPWSDATIEHYGYRVYLFYGKRDFPAQLSTADADAMFEAGVLPTVALGDVNGDGLADFALSYESGTEIVFGTATRFEGTRAPFTSGVAWNPEHADGSPLYMQPLGDLDGDGMNEVRVTIISQVPVEEASNRGSEIITDYVIAGRVRLGRRGTGMRTGRWRSSGMSRLHTKTTVRRQSCSA